MPTEDETAFRTNPNKDYLRSNYDRELVESWAAIQGRRLKYLGLPGPEILDIIAWQECLESFTTIERSAGQQHLLFLRANVTDVEHRLNSLYGEFDKILLTGRDRYGHTPDWPYDLVNLDFYGGLLYIDLARPKAIRKLIDNQAEYHRGFLLIITCHIRDSDLAREKLGFLNDLEAKLSRDYPDRKTREVIAWYRSDETPDAARQTLYLNTLLHDLGEVAQFAVTCRAAILYSGTGGAQMIHFVTTFELRDGAHRVVSNQSMIDVVNLGYLKLVNERLVSPIAAPRL